MTRVDEQNGQDQISAAIDRVLRAERAAEEVIESHRRKARAMLEDARITALKIARLADARITRMQAAQNRKIEAEILRLREAAARALKTIDQPLDEEMLLEAIERLAGRLTNGSNERAD
jgi:hypothetical protein